MEDKISEAIKNAVEGAPERKFVESLDIAFTIKDIDLKNPNNRIQEEIRLPAGRGKAIKVAMFAASDAAQKARAAGIHVIDPSEIEELGKNKGNAKKLANSYDFFLSEVPHMGLIGRYLGVVLGPRGKMPRPVPPVVDPSVIANGLQSTTVIKSRDKITFQASFGTCSQSHEELVKNAMEVYNRVISKLERGIGNIRSLYIKTTMGPSNRIEVIN
ncbi:MAG: 50S ribosomal protein L1 [Candidatus Thermoplasmatota archaeon]|nr:50S ribosomal protein L1 [Euryarchaeota archaeon]MEE2985020.1 50S ribosomal protein L1 [Candidatus Thermoplasmatota archaeon]|tara:strand:+ start:418 stop:1062 length:645 start_codon:yes stop_codon:yes gene_type:complete